MQKRSDKIPRRSKQCLECERSFVLRERLHSILTAGERRDYCLECWDKIQQRDAESRWTLRIPEKKSREEKALWGEERLFALLREAPEGDAMLLALYLERRGLIDRVKMGRRKITYKARRSEEFFEVSRAPLESVDPARIVRELEEAYGSNR